MSQAKLILLITSLVFALATHGLAQTSTESSIATTVKLTFSAIDSYDSPFRSLSKEDLRILEDGRPQQIIELEHQVESPLTLSFLFDMSVSQESMIPSARAAANAFVGSRLRPGKDVASITAFTGELSVKQAFTDNVKELQSAINGLEFVPPPGYIGGGVVVGVRPGITPTLAGSTAMFDAICATSEQMLAHSSPKSIRVIVLLTDGIDTSSQRTLNDAVNCAIKSNATIYAVGFADEKKFPVEKGVLRKLTERTGGRALFPEKDTEIASSLAQVQRELQFQYVATYSSSTSKSLNSRKIEIEIVSPQRKKDKLRLAYPHVITPN